MAIGATILAVGVLYLARGADYGVASHDRVRRHFKGTL